MCESKCEQDKKCSASINELQAMSRTDSDRSSNDLHDADDSMEPRATDPGLRMIALLIPDCN